MATAPHDKAKSTATLPRNGQSMAIACCRTRERAPGAAAPSGRRSCGPFSVAFGTTPADSRWKTLPFSLPKTVLRPSPPRPRILNMSIHRPSYLAWRKHDPMESSSRKSATRLSGHLRLCLETVLSTHNISPSTVSRSAFGRPVTSISVSTRTAFVASPADFRRSRLSMPAFARAVGLLAMLPDFVNTASQRCRVSISPCTTQTTFQSNIPPCWHRICGWA